MSNISICPIDRTLSGATTPGQSGPGSDGNDGVLHFPQSSSITGLVWFGLVSLFNGISTFVGYLMPKLFSKKNSSDTI